MHRMTACFLEENAENEGKKKTKCTVERTKEKRKWNVEKRECSRKENAATFLILTKSVELNLNQTESIWFDSILSFF